MATTYCVGVCDSAGVWTAIDGARFETARQADRYRRAISADDADVCIERGGRISPNRAKRVMRLGELRMPYAQGIALIRDTWLKWGESRPVNADFLQFTDGLNWDRKTVAIAIRKIAQREAREASGPNDTALFALGIDGQPRLVSRYGTEPPDWREARFNAGLARFGLCGETVLRLSEAQIADRDSAYVQRQIAFNPARGRKPVTDPIKIMKASQFWEARRRRSLAEARRQRNIMSRDNLLARLYNGQSVETPPSVKARTLAERIRLAFTCAISATPSAPTEIDAAWAERQGAMMRRAKAMTAQRPTALYGLDGRSEPRSGTGYSDSPECGWSLASMPIRNMASESETESAVDAICEALASAMGNAGNAGNGL